MDRRSVVVGLAALGGAAGLTLAGCGPVTRTPGARADREATDDGVAADRRLVTTALNAELTAVATFERTRRRHPALRDVTAQGLATHVEHVRLLRGTLEEPRSGPSEAVRVPGRPRVALQALTRLEAGLSARHVSAAMAASSGALARVVASMAVAAAQLEQLLGESTPSQAAGASR